MSDLARRAMAYHANPTPGKLAIHPTTPLETQEDLSLAYTPGVGIPVMEIAADPDAAYATTAKGNLVAIISNGSAILGLGNQGALASKPVMEGKAVLFKTFAGIDVFDIEMDESDPEKLIEAITMMAPTFGGINLEDIKAPECFIIEHALKERLNIPVFHDDQHGTAIVVGAGLINALEVAKKSIENVKIVINGAGAAGIAIGTFLKSLGAAHVVLCDSRGVVFKDRTEGMNPYKRDLAVDTDARMLEDAAHHADVLIGVSKKDLFTTEMLQSMNQNPIVFAMANPDPEILPDKAKRIREDVIIATGRSDYPNQINNLLCFPFLFRGALDVRATEINDAMKCACTRSLADLAREPVPAEVLEAYNLSNLTFGRDYLIPKPFDPRLITTVAPAVAQAAQESGVATLTNNHPTPSATPVG